MCHTRNDLEAAERPGAAGLQPGSPGEIRGGRWWVWSQLKVSPRGPDPRCPASEGVGRAGSGQSPDRCRGTQLPPGQRRIDPIRINVCLLWGWAGGSACSTGTRWLRWVPRTLGRGQPRPPGGSRHLGAARRPSVLMVWLWISPDPSVLALSTPSASSFGGFGLCPRVADDSVPSPQLRPRGHGGRRGGRRAADHRHGPGAAGHVRERAASPHRATTPGLRQHRRG